MKIYLNKKYSYPIEILGKVRLDGETYFVTKATPVEEDMEVVVKLLKVRTVLDGLLTSKYSYEPLKEVKERSSVLDYEKSSLCMEFYEAGYEDALVDLGVLEPENDEEDLEDEETLVEKANEELKVYSTHPDVFKYMTPEEKIMTSIGFELPNKRLEELKKIANDKK